MPTYTFNTGNVARRGFVAEVQYATADAIRHEPMLFQCSREFAEAHGGPLTRACLRRLPYEHVRIDTRSHMLMPGQYPCIPGWHCDFKQVAPDGTQVHDEDTDASTRHLLCTSPGAPTDFLLDRDVEVSVPRLTWGEVDRYVCRAEPACASYEPGTLIEFDANELHRGSPHTGEPCHWRYFFRATQFAPGDPRRGAYANEIRTQVQVYCDVHAGW